MRFRSLYRIGGIHYVLAVLWMGLIFFFSTDVGSFPNTFRYFEPILRVIFPHMTAHTLLLVHLWMRKLAHVAEYAILSYFWFRAFNHGERKWSAQSALLALALSVLYALLDEYHQTFIPSRTASLIDVGIDSLGALIAQVYLFIVLQQPLTESSRGKNIVR